MRFLPRFNLSPWPLRRVSLLLLSCVAVRGFDPAATVYWNGGDGTWDTTDAEWTTDAALAGGFAAWENASALSATFNGPAGTVTLANAITAGRVTFGSDGFTLTGSTLTLSAAGVIDTGSGSQTLSSVLAGAVTSFTKSGSGTLVLGGANTYTGATIVTGGTLAVRGSLGVASASASTMSVGSTGHATLRIENGGSVKNTSATLGGASGMKGTVVVDGASSLWNVTNTTGTTLSIASGGSGSVTISHGGSFTSVRPASFTSTAGNTGELLVTGTGSTFTSTNLNIQGAGTGTLTISDGGIVNSASSSLGNSSGTGGTVTALVTGAGSRWNLTSGSTPSLAMYGGTSLSIADGGTANIGWSVYLGDTAGQTATINVGGNSSTLNVLNAAFVVGDFGGGTLNLANGGVVNAGFNFRLGNDDAAIGIVNQTGGTLTVGRYMEFNKGTLEYRLLGGTYVGQDYSGIAAIQDYGTATYLFELGGGTVQAGTGNFTSNANATLKAGTTSTLNAPLSASQVMAWQGALTGSGTLRKTGAGILVLNNAANTYSGGTILEQGILNPAVSGALGTGTLTFAGNATLQLPNSQTVTVTLANDIAIDPNVTATVSVQNRTLTLNGAITGDGALNKTGASLLVLGGDNTYSGATTISAGILRANSAGALSPHSNLQLAGGVLELGAGAPVAFTHGTGGGQLQWTGSGGFSSFGADRAIAYQNGAALTWGAADFVPNGGTFILSSAASNATTTFANAIDFAGGARTVQVDNGSASIDASLTGVLGNGSLIKTGAGTLALSGANTYSGGTTINGGALKFASGSLGSGSLTVSGGELQWAAGNTDDISASLTLGAGGATFNTNGNDVSFAGALTGSGAFAKAGTGTLTLHATGTSTGATNTVNGGTLRFGAAAALAAGKPLVVNGTLANGSATLDLAGHDFAVTTLTFGGNTAGANAVNTVATGSGTLTLGGNITYNFASVEANDPGTASITGKLNLGSAVRTITTADSTNTATELHLAADISSGANSGLIKAGTGTLVLSGTNTYTGNTTLNAGTLILAGAQALPSTGNLILAGGTLAASGGERSISNAVTLSANAAIGGSAALTFTGTFTNSGGNRILSVSNSGLTTFGDLFLSETTNTRTLTLAGAGPVAITGTIANRSGAGSNVANLTKSGAGTVTLSGTNTFTGTLTASAGTLRATTSAGALGAGTLTLSGAALQLANDTGLAFNRNTTVSAATTITSDRLTAGAGVTHSLNTLSIGAQTLTLLAGANATSGVAGLTFGAVTATGNATFNTGAGAHLTLASVTGTNRNLTFTGSGLATAGALATGTGSLSKTGAGTLVLSGVNTYTGATTVGAGALFVNGSLAATAVTIASGATLGGDGTVGGLTTVQSGGRLSPGTLTFAGGLSLQSGSILDFQLGSTTDLIRVAGGTLFGPASGLVTLNFSNAGDFDFVDGSTYTLFDFSGATLDHFDVDGFGFGTLLGGTTESSYFLTLDTGAQTLSVTFVASAIPEPSTYAALAGLACLALAFHRRRARAA